MFMLSWTASSQTVEGSFQLATFDTFEQAETTLKYIAKKIGVDFDDNYSCYDDSSFNPTLKVMFCPALFTESFFITEFITPPIGAQSWHGFNESHNPTKRRINSFLKWLNY
jgi:hypothetical protein